MKRSGTSITPYVTIETLTGAIPKSVLVVRLMLKHRETRIAIKIVGRRRSGQFTIRPSIPRLFVRDESVDVAQYFKWRKQRATPIALGSFMRTFEA